MYWECLYMNNLLNELNSLKSNLDNLPIMNLSDLDLNNTDLFIVDINNGFANSKAFAKAFKKKNDILPSEYRKRMKQ